MKNKKLVARIGYDKTNDEYQLRISTDGGETWNYSMGAKCTRSVKDEPDAEPMFVSCTLIEELKKCIALGYEVVY